jgi:hypothetical protein
MRRSGSLWQIQRATTCDHHPSLSLPSCFVLIFFCLSFTFHFLPLFFYPVWLHPFFCLSPFLLSLLLIFLFSQYSTSSCFPLISSASFLVFSHCSITLLFFLPPFLVFLLLHFFCFLIALIYYFSFFLSSSLLYFVPSIFSLL